VQEGGDRTPRPHADSGGIDVLDADAPDVADATKREGTDAKVTDATSAEVADANAPEAADVARPEVADANGLDAVDANAPETSSAEKITLVQQAGSDFTPHETSGASEGFASPNTAGNAIIVLGFWQALGYSATISDSVGNSYTSTTAAINPQQGVLQIFYAARARPGANTVTLTMSAGFNNYVGLAIFEYAGLSGSDIFEGSAGQYASAATAAASTPPVTTTFPSSLLFAGVADVNGSGNIAAGSGWTPLVTNDAFYMVAESKIVSNPGSFSATATVSKTDDRWVALMAAFQGAP
jgi:hypothetical protein